MLKETVTYKDFDGVNRTETLYFNLTRSDLIEHLYVIDRVEQLQKKLVGDGTARVLTMLEVQEILDLVKLFMEMSYGERKDVGDRQLFVKGGEVWANFKQSAAYDVFVMSLFTDVAKANQFLLNVLPEELRQAAEAEIAGRSQVASVTDIRPVALNDEPNLYKPAPDGEVLNASGGPKPFEKNYYDYTRAELIEMPQDEFDSLVGTKPSDMSKEQMSVAMQRMQNRANEPRNFE